MSIHDCPLSDDCQPSLVKFLLDLMLPGYQFVLHGRQYMRGNLVVEESVEICVDCTCLNTIDLLFACGSQEMDPIYFS